MVNKQHNTTPERVFGARLREARKRKGWTQAELSGRLSELGYPLDRTMIAKLEGGRAKLTALRNLFALAVALDVSPLNLIVPLEDDADVQLEVIPGLAVTAPVARAWIRGVWGLPPTDAFGGTDMATFLSETAESDLRSRIKEALRSRPNGPATLAEILSGTASFEPDDATVDAFVRQIRQLERKGDDG